MKLKGIDISTWKQEVQFGAKYYDHGEERDLLSICRDYGVNAIRLRLWHTPYSVEGVPYGAGNNDLMNTIAMAKEVVAAGFEWLLDLHYSDFWTDPGKQIKPKAWQKLSYDELVREVEVYTESVMRALVEAKASPSMVQVGNELSNGLLWPDGQVPEYDHIAELVSAGIRGVRKVDAKVPIMIHLDNGGNQELYTRWFDNYLKRGLDFQVIGLSYYPFWHGTLGQLEDNMQMLAKRYGKELVVAEVSMGFTTEDYSLYEGLRPEDRKGMATKEELVSKIEYPMSEQGQADFMQDFLTRIDRVPGCLGFFYWEPAWIPVKGCGWATEASLQYMKDTGPCGNEWANQALFDFNGNTLKAWNTIKEF